jgi:phosphoribosylanthranilate isomerase
VAEARLAIRCGADVVGLVSAMPSGAGMISDGRIRRIAARIPPEVGSFLLTSRSDAASIVRQHRQAPTSAIQLVDELPEVELERIHRALPEVALVQVLHVESREAIAHAERLAPLVDYLLLDSGRPSAPVPELGGTGRTHDWAISAELVAAVATPVFLAGGLDPSNVGAAIRQVRPFGVDVCSRLRPGGRLDPDLLVAFIAAVRAADRAT